MRIRATTSRFVALALAGVLAGGAAAALAATPDEIIAERRAGYKHIGDNFKAMKDAVEGGADVAPLAGRAQEVADWAARIPSLFPPGTETGGGTHAKPEIWSDRAGFEAASRDLLAAATKLQKAAASGDKAAFAEQFKATGATCGACHRTYRYKL